MVRALKGLEHAITYDVVDWLLDENGNFSTHRFFRYSLWWLGWKFDVDGKCPGATKDTVNGVTFLRELYLKQEPDYKGRFTVPVLWDKKQQKIGATAFKHIFCTTLMAVNSV
jgi:putative glutathione S-transferase